MFKSTSIFKLALLCTIITFSSCSAYQADASTVEKTPVFEVQLPGEDLSSFTIIEKGETPVIASEDVSKVMAYVRSKTKGNSDHVVNLVVDRNARNQVVNIRFYLQNKYAGFNQPFALVVKPSLLVSSNVDYEIEEVHFCTGSVGGCGGFLKNASGKVAGCGTEAGVWKNVDCPDPSDELNNHTISTP